MKPFDPTDDATDTSLGSERLQAFSKALWTALVPSSGSCKSVQGEMVRGNDRLRSEYLRNGMGNYYVEDQSLAQNYYGDLALLILDTLTANRNGALAANDVAYFAQARRSLEADRTSSLRIRDLEQKEEELTEDEAKELDALFNSERVHWEALCNRAERCIANWCIANPKFVDRQGRPVEDGGLQSVEHVFNAPPPPPKCPKCNGKGFFQPEDPRRFPEKCSCQGPGRI